MGTVGTRLFGLRQPTPKGHGAPEVAIFQLDEGNVTFQVARSYEGVIWPPGRQPQV